MADVQATQITKPDDDMEEMERSLQVTRGRVFLVILILLGALAGFWLSQAVFPRPQIGVVRLYDVIDYFTAPAYLGPLHEAASSRDIAAVVVLVDSPGGDATVSEELFFTILELRGNKPVVASIERFGASGAYYAAAASNYIFARPAAQVGSIGVIGGFPDEFRPDDNILTTGPFKGSGHSKVDFMRDVEAVKEAFLTHVYDQRSYALEHMHAESRLDSLPERDMIATGQIWVGSRALEIGLIDELGSNREAIAKAAQLAGIANYRVVDLTARFFELEDDEFLGYSIGGGTDWYTEGPWVELYHLYLMPEE